MLGSANQKALVAIKLHSVIHHPHSDGTAYPSGKSPIHMTAKTGKPAHRDNEVFFRADGSNIPVEYWVRPIIFGGALKGAICTFVDIRDRRRFEEQQGLLLKEMDHRVKNLFAIINSVVSMSARSATGATDLAETIIGRVGALSKAHDLIRQSDPGSEPSGLKTTLSALISTILASHIDMTKSGADARAKLEGPDVEIGSASITTVALVIHELATNAAKYGPFSNGDGRVEVVWFVEKGCLELS